MKRLQAWRFALCLGILSTPAISEGAGMGWENQQPETGDMDIGLATENPGRQLDNMPEPVRGVGFTVNSPEDGKRYVVAPELKFISPERADVLCHVNECVIPRDGSQCDQYDWTIPASKLQCNENETFCSFEGPFDFRMAADKAYTLYIQPAPYNYKRVIVEFEVVSKIELPADSRKVQPAQPSHDLTQSPELRQPVRRSPDRQDLKEATSSRERVKKADLNVTVKPPQGNNWHYNFIIRNDGEVQAKATMLYVSLGPPCPVPGFMSERRLLEKAQIKELPVTVQNSLAYSHGYVLPEPHTGSGCELQGHIDLRESIPDSDRGNNVAKIAIRYEPRADLVVVMGSGGTSENKQIGIQNMGDGAAGPSNLHFACHSSQQSVGTEFAYWPCDPTGDSPSKTWNMPVPGLAPREIHYANFPLTAYYPKHTYWRAWIDSERAVKEWNEHNNTRTSD